MSAGNPAGRALEYRGGGAGRRVSAAHPTISGPQQRAAQAARKIDAARHFAERIEVAFCRSRGMARSDDTASYMAQWRDIGNR